jgi:hypothetical protein
MVHPAPFFLLRSLAPPPPVPPVIAVVCRAPPVHHEKPSHCTVPPPSLIKPNPVESPPPPLKSFENRWGLKPTSPADCLRSPPWPPGPYKRAPHPRPSSPRSFLLSSPHPSTPSTSSLSLLHRRLPSSTPGRPSPSTISCHPGYGSPSAPLAPHAAMARSRAWERRRAPPTASSGRALPAGPWWTERITSPQPVDSVHRFSYVKINQNLD